MDEVAPLTGSLFVIGAARSGTTILQNALNHSRDIFILGEPDLHMDAADAGFAARYNAMHAGWGNQPTKSSFCPPILGVDGAWRSYFDRLGTLHRWAGSKIVVNVGCGADWIDQLYAFHCRNFYTARYIFTFRDPLSVVGSTRGLQALTGNPVASVAAVLANYADVVALFVRMLRTMPHVRGVIHEDIARATFDGLGEWIEVPLDGSADYYEAGRTRHYRLDVHDPDDRGKLELVGVLYNDLRAELGRGIARPQLEQNDGNIDPKHYTMLGSIARRAAVIAAAYGAEAAS